MTTKQKTEDALGALGEGAGKKLPKPLAEAIARKRLFDAAKAEVAAEVKAAGDDLEATRRAAPSADADALIAHVEAGGDAADLDLGVDLVEEKRATLEKARRKMSAASSAAERASATFSAALRSKETETFLASCWGTFAEPPKSSDTWATVQRKSAVAEGAFSIIGGLLVALARDEAAKHEIKALRDAIAARPLVMPTLQSVRQRRRTEAASKGLEKTRREQEEARAARRELDKATAQAAARDRIEAALGGTPAADEGAEEVAEVAAS